MSHSTTSGDSAAVETAGSITSVLISQSHLRTPPCFSKSLLINSLPRPPENVSSLIPASPPPPKHPDLYSPLVIFSPPPPVPPRPASYKATRQNNTSSTATATVH
ncbi:hypothetical protein A2U01_0024032 [Trifolium medium]|uniref:Uncharacterized protein n=1 Tax=Trifolium medium TaxID=97028 RepID=A0A392NSZ7_9FABA|nr:hypothetical protein [Trifolium medium]